MSKEDKNVQIEESVFHLNIKRGIAAKVIDINEENNRVTYFAKRSYSTSLKNPEESVRAAYFVELILDYAYPKDRIDIEVTVPRRTPVDRADIVVYEDDECKNPYLVVECKKDGITDAEFIQAIEQAFGNANSVRAKYAIVVAGNTKTAFDVAGFKPYEREINVIADIPVKFGKTPKYRFRKGDEERDLQIVTREELIKTLEKVHDTVWQGGKLAPTNAFDEVAKVLFCKLKDEKDGTRKGEYYRFQIGTHEKASEVSDRVNSIYQNAKIEDPEVFKEDIDLDVKIIYSVVEHLQAISLNKTDLDIKGVAFERFMQDFFKGKMGQFFTPRPIVEFCVQMLQPGTSDLVLDPACGSGGFLLHALDAVKKFADDNYDEREAWDYWHRFALNNLYGIEINEQIARVCKMNMIIHDDGHSNIVSSDALKSFQEITNIHKDIILNHFDLIITNPPFGASIKSSEKNYLNNFDLGHGKNSQKSEILFVERCIDFSKIGIGRIGMVIPDSITINSSLQYVRDYIFDRVQVLAVVSLPGFAFSHYGANVKSSLLFMRRLDEDEELQNYPVFMAKANTIGYTATGKEDLENDLLTIVDHYNRFLREGNGFSIDENYIDDIYIIHSSELRGNRIDPKGYSPKFKDLKRVIDSKDFPKVLLKDCCHDTYSGEWGVDPNLVVDTENFELCYVIRNTNFDNDFNLNLSDVAQRYIPKKKVGKLSLVENDILIEKSGGSPYQPVGRVAIIKNLQFDRPVVFSNFLQKIIIDDSIINPIYVYTYLRTLYHKGYMEYIQNQTTGIKNLLMDEFFSIPIIQLDEDQQIEISRKYISDYEEAMKKVEDAYKLLHDSRTDVEELIL